MPDLKLRPAVRKAAPPSRRLGLIGKRFNRLTIREILPDGLCRCDCECGTTGFETESYSVAHNLTKSCGCWLAQKVKDGCNLSHGESRKGQWTPEYRAWVNMITRCHNPNATRYKDWGGRGITVCEEWRNNYEAFLAHIGRKPSPRHSIDRFPNNSGNYEPGNVRWATPREQNLNQRPRRRKCA